MLLWDIGWCVGVEVLLTWIKLAVQLQHEPPHLWNGLSTEGFTNAPALLSRTRIFSFGSTARRNQCWLEPGLHGTNTMSCYSNGAFPLRRCSAGFFPTPFSNTSHPRYSIAREPWQAFAMSFRYASIAKLVTYFSLSDGLWPLSASKSCFSIKALPWKGTVPLSRESNSDWSHSGRTQPELDFLNVAASDAGTPNPICAGMLDDWLLHVLCFLFPVESAFGCLSGGTEGLPGWCWCCMCVSSGPSSRSMTVGPWLLAVADEVPFALNLLVWLPLSANGLHLKAFFLRRGGFSYFFPEMAHGFLFLDVIVFLAGGPSTNIPSSDGTDCWKRSLASCRLFFNSLSALASFDIYVMPLISFNSSRHCLVSLHM